MSEYRRGQRPLDWRPAGTRAIVVTHMDTTGPISDLAEFLVGSVGELLRIDHSMFRGKRNASTVARYVNGRKVAELVVNVPRLLPEPVHWLAQMLVTLIATCRFGRHDLFIGCGAINGLLGPLLSQLGLCRISAMFTIDFMSRRFPGALLNWAYHRVDRFCANHCDVIWNLGEAMAEARKRVWGDPGSAPQIVVPVSIRFSNFEKLDLDKKNNRTVCYFGSLLPKQGVAVLVESISLARKTIPDLELLIIGDGPARDELEALADRVGLKGHVRFTGYVDDHAEAERLLMACGLAVATFDPSPDNFTYQTEPGKLKVYCAAGLPVLMTDVPEIARRIADAGAGVLVPYDPEAVAREIVELVTDPKRLRAAQTAAVEFARDYDWLRVYGSALERTYDIAGLRAS